MSWGCAAAAAAWLKEVAMTEDGIFLGMGMAYIGCSLIGKYKSLSSTIHKIGLAAELQPSDLRSILSGNEDDRHVDKLVVIRGIVELKSDREKWNCEGFGGANLLSAEVSGKKGVITEQSHTIPFVLVESGNFFSDFVVVNMDGSKHTLPLETVHQHYQPFSVVPGTFFLQFGILYKEKILPLGKDITAVGICHLKDGTPEIMCSKDLPYFMSDLTKDQMLAGLSVKAKLMMYGGAILCSIALGFLGYSVRRNWRKWKRWIR